MARAFHTLSLLSAIVLAAGCSVEEAPAPPLTGPSELSLSLTMAATPDTIAQDGSSQALVVVVARDVSGRAVANLPIRFDVMKDGQIVDFGGLSAKTGLTGADGRAQVVYTAPTPPLSSPTPAASPSTVSVLATPTGANYANAVARTVEIRLVPAGTVYNPGTGPEAAFAVDGILDDPIAAKKPNVAVGFDASASSSPAGLTSYAWDFGDGTIDSGVGARHTYSTGGTYAVRLTVTDKNGKTAWKTRFVTVAAGPTAIFSSGVQVPYVVFDGSASWAVPPATISASGYLWVADVQGFTSCPGFRPSADGRKLFCDYVAGRTYAVTLVVTDSSGLVGRMTQTITVQ